MLLSRQSRVCGTATRLAALLTAAWLCSLIPASGQTTAAVKTAGKAVTPVSSLKRTPDGQLDMEGIYVRRGIWGLADDQREANGPRGKDDPLEDDEFSELPDTPKPWYQGSGANFPQGGSGRVTLVGPAPPEPRRLGLVDPPDRILPWKPEEDKRRREFLAHTNPPASLRYVEFDARCALPGLFLNGGPFEFIQTSKQVVILSEYQHYTRTIHLDGRPHVGSRIRLFMGDSIGHWEGNTLIVDTTNFNAFTAFTRTIPYLSDALHTAERYTVVDRNNIDYEVTVDDPKLFTKPWKTAALYRRGKDFEMTEYACAEGSQELVNMFGKPPGY
jgi:hypothetical protein